MLAILTTHPIQYQVPLWQALASDGRVPFEVWYLTDHGTRQTRDREFGKTFSWDLDTLSGYPYQFLNVAPSATPSSFLKCRLQESLRQRLRNSKVKVLWTQGWQVAAYWQAVREAKAAGVEVWLRGESNDLSPVPWWKRPLKRLQLGWLFKRVDRFLYIGSANKRLYQKYGVPESQLHSAPYAVDNDWFARQAAELKPRRSVIRREWGIPEDAFCILFCGKFISKKRSGDLIGAAKLLHQNGRIAKTHLLFVGSGELDNVLRRACSIAFDADAGGLQALRLDDGPWRPSATFAGFLNQKEISRAYVAADCLVLPSDYGETWGLVVNEAMASGLPCAASRACGCAEDLLCPYWPERTFNLGDHAGLANAIVLISQANSSGELEKRQVSSHSMEATVKQIVRLYEAS